MTEPLVLVDRTHPAITLLTLNRPDKRNALNIELLQALCAAIEETQNDPTQRVLILQGAGPTFCAGLDLQEALDKSKEESSSHLLAKSFTTLYQTPLITIAAVHGAALAGGGGLMAACDIVIAAAGTSCGFPEVRRGLVPAQIGVFLRRQMQWRALRELLLLGEVIDVERAQHYGLVNLIVPSGELQHAVLKVAHDILKGAPEAIKETKRLLGQLDAPFQEEINIALPFHQRARASEEAREGMKAFLEKRNPQWHP